TGICSQRDSSTVSPEIMVGLTKGLVEALVYIQDPNHKREVMEVLRKNLRLSKDEDVEASYKVTRQQMPSLAGAPSPRSLEAYSADCFADQCEGSGSRFGSVDCDERRP